MKNTDLLKAIGETDAVYIEDAGIPEEKMKNEGAHGRKKLLFPYKRTIAAVLAACIVVAAAALVFTFWGRQREPYADPPPPGSTSSPGTGPEVSAPLLHWEEMTVLQKFHSLVFRETFYSSSRSAVIAPEQAGELLGTFPLLGRDHYEPDTEHRLSVSVYCIPDVAPECAVAVEISDTEESRAEGITDAERSVYYIYLNAYYIPDTLGDFIEDLNLKKLISFGDVYSGQVENGEYKSYQYTGLPADAVWTLLLQDRSIPSVKDYDTHLFGPVVMTVGVDIPLFGYENIALSVTEDGYLTTNILDTGKAFYIGTENVTQFAEYVQGHCEAHEIVHSGGEGTDAVPEMIIPD